MTEDTQELELAHRMQVGDNAWMWDGSANGHATQIIVASSDVEVRVKPILTPKIQGVALVDQDGRELTQAITWIGPPEPAEPEADLTAWLLEQIAEDQRVAGAAAELPNRLQRPMYQPPRPGVTYRGTAPSYSTFIRAWPPARVLAECEAKRQIICILDPEGDSYDRHVLKLLALPYADRPGYREGWAP